MKAPLRTAVLFTNFGPYHLARLRASGQRFATDGGEVVGIELASNERLYPWRTQRRPDEPFQRVTLFPDAEVESLKPSACRAAIFEALDRLNVSAVAVAGYVRPECLAALKWAEGKGRIKILMSETQKLDHPRRWWKEAIKSRRIQRFDAALVGGPRHRDYLVELGLPGDRIALGYNAVDHVDFAERAQLYRSQVPIKRPHRHPYFLAINRFAPEKNLLELIRAYSDYRRAGGTWDLVLCGDGPESRTIEAEIELIGLERHILCTGFLQTHELIPWLSFAEGFVHPSRMEPWGLVVNEAAACSRPLLVSERAGCVETLVPDPPGQTGRRFDPFDRSSIRDALLWLEGTSPSTRAAMGRRAFELVGQWGPDRFADGLLEALARARGQFISSPDAQSHAA